MSVWDWLRLWRVARGVRRAWSTPLVWAHRPRTTGPGWRRNRDVAQRSTLSFARPTVQVVVHAALSETAEERRILGMLRKRGVLIDMQGRACDPDDGDVFIVLWSQAAARAKGAIETMDAAAAYGRLLLLLRPNAPAPPPRFEFVPRLAWEDDIALERELLRRGIIFYPASIMAAGLKTRAAPDPAQDADRALDFLLREIWRPEIWRLKIWRPETGRPEIWRPDVPQALRLFGLRHPGGLAARDAEWARRWDKAADAAGVVLCAALLLLAVVLVEAGDVDPRLALAALFAILPAMIGCGLVKARGFAWIRRRVRARLLAARR